MFSNQQLTINSPSTQQAVEHSTNLYSTNNSANMRHDPLNSYLATASNIQLFTQLSQPTGAQFHPGLALTTPTVAQNDIRVQLEDRDLWSRFYQVTNEMILTKAGRFVNIDYINMKNVIYYIIILFFYFRRTFPLIKVRIQGLDETELYTIQIEFRIADQYKYRFVNGEWKTSLRNDYKQAQQTVIVHQHTDSPNFGHHWSKDVVVFGKLKLTNNENTKNPDAVFLKSLHKYEPVVHILKHDKKNVDDKVLIFSKSFVETQFIAVTAYQNENVNPSHAIKISILFTFN